ncbi:vacuolar protein sorting-associated protein [Reticulomyxa filosa]|uniref:Vacuolar protein sorting-associated protein n=1 Tax=Reticulomyxa filosa TaxID=46433 RepID=X6MS39_RETFI|nr:vacuolar protein sorting-associated protein [Reticulomyxa filosa]|eukprot:ETO16481.1 vacuolar protein sorting-associated protein [Reticulomyxa filosa]
MGQRAISNEKELFAWQESENKPLLLILDRKDDPVTPLLSQWTYQAMVHELLTITNSRVHLPSKTKEKEEEKKSIGEATIDVLCFLLLFICCCELYFTFLLSQMDIRIRIFSTPSPFFFLQRYHNATFCLSTPIDGLNVQEVVMNPFNDKFFEENLMKNYGEFAETTQRYVQQFAAKRKETCGLKTIEDMQKFVENYPEFLAEQGSVSKHLAVVHELRDVVARRKMMDISLLEQEMVCENKSTQHFNELEKHIKDASIQDFDKLRLALIYVLRYEHKLRDLLRQNCKFEGREVELLNSITKYFGTGSRSTPLFDDEKSNLIGKLTAFAKFKVSDVECVFTQHKPLLSRVIDDVMKNQLKLEQYPSISGKTFKER